MGRRHTCRQTEEAYALARQMGFSHINMDLIAGLPGENLQMFEETLTWLRSLAPESMTVHTLSIKRSSLLHLWEAQLPDGEMVADMVRAGAASKRLVDRQGFIRRAFNVSDIRQYISRVDEMAQRKRDLFLGGNAPASCKSENVPENA